MFRSVRIHKIVKRDCSFTENMIKYKENYFNRKDSFMSRQQYLECGRAVSTHGVRGTLRLESYCNNPETLAKLRTLYKKNKTGGFDPMRVRAASVQKNMVLVTFEDIKTLDEAIPYKSCMFYLDRSDLKLCDGEVFIADILGHEIVDVDNGEKYGILKEVLSPSGRDVYVVRDEENGKEFMIPAVDEFIKEIDVDGGKIYVRLIEGMRE